MSDDREALVSRNIAVAVPARNEAARIRSCLESLRRLERDARVGRVELVLAANNCSDETSAIARAWAGETSTPLHCLEVDLPEGRAHAGWARRLALDAAADTLAAADDLILCTDADTLAAPDWLVRTLDHLDRGYDAVAGLAVLRPDELRRLPKLHRRRLDRIRRYEFAFDYLKAYREREEAWPRHFYEGGASIALTLESYRAIGGAPTPRVSEDKALFAALRAAGRLIRHARDVRVHTSCRLDGRAPGGAADTLARWGVQGEGEPLWGLKTVGALQGLEPDDTPLTFARLEAETRTARRLVRRLRNDAAPEGGRRRSATAPYVEPVIRRTLDALGAVGAL